MSDDVESPADFNETLLLERHKQRPALIEARDRLIAKRERERIAILVQCAPWLSRAAGNETAAAIRALPDEEPPT